MSQTFASVITTTSHKDTHSTEAMKGAFQYTQNAAERREWDETEDVPCKNYLLKKKKQDNKHGVIKTDP